jgi:hypothetical protein
MQLFSATLLQELPNLRGVVEPELYNQLAFLGDDNVSNKSAIDNLMTMGTKRRYLFAGANPETSTVLPGVKIHVLGPPTLEQSKDIRKQRSHDEAEFWELKPSGNV